MHLDISVWPPNTQYGYQAKAPSQKRLIRKHPRYSQKLPQVISAPIKGYMEFADSFRPPTLSSSLKFDSYEVFISKQCIKKIAV